MEKMLLIDGNSLLFRAYYATCYGRMMRTSSGMPTNAIFALAAMINKILILVEPTYCVVAFDKGKHTFRHELFAEYKGGRKETPEDLVPQFKLSRDFFEAYNIKYLEYDNIEADDIIGTLSKKYPNIQVDIFSSDKDLLQLIDETTNVYLMKKGVSEVDVMNVATLFDKMFVTPEQIIELKALMGDSSDNIPGVKGVGEKTAIKLLSIYQNIDNIYANIEDISGKTKELLINGEEICRLSKRLATIKTDVTIDEKLDELTFVPANQSLYDFFIKYEMKSLANKVKIANADEPNIQMERVTQINEGLLNDDSIIYFETDDFNYLKPEVYGMAITNGITTQFITIDDLLKDHSLLGYIKGTNRKVLYDLKKTYHILRMINVEISDNVYDVRLAAFLSDSTLMNYANVIARFDLVDYCSLVELYGTPLKPRMIDEVMQVNYACNCACNIHKIYQKLKTIIKEYDLEYLLNDVEIPLSKILFDMECEGIAINMDVLNEIATTTMTKLELLTKEIYENVGHDFNINSPKQLAVVLFDELNLPANKKRSTAVENLEKLMDIHPIINNILSYRKYAKIYSTYAEGLKKYVESDGRIHTIFNQCATLTGRLSSIEPNLQNISVRDEEAKEIRRAFIPSTNNILMTCDYSQVELRILADLANEDKLIDAFKKNIDIHIKTAAEIFHLNIDEVDATYRRKAKAVNFGVVYGMSDFGLAAQVDATLAEAKAFISQYFESYPNIKRYMDNVVVGCEEHGYVTTMLNRRRYIDEIHSSSYMIKEFGKRAAMNTPIQGSAADLIKLAMVNVNSEMKTRKLKSKMILQVHDELIFDVHLDELDEMKTLVINEMEGAMELKVPLQADLSTGYSWYDAK